ncbi:MAG: thioredoxin family protein [Bacteroidales bacterium]|nr:thioredoxin family protein [Bacteroidales bacterium]
MKKTVLSFLFLVLGIHLFAQEIVYWNFESKKLDDNTLELVMTASIENEWYIYSLQPGDGPMPTTFTFTSGPEYELIGGVTERFVAKEKYDEGFGKNVKTFEFSAVFVQKIKRLTDKAFTVNGSVLFQACSGMECTMNEKKIAVSVKAADPIQPVQTVQPVQQTETQAAVPPKTSRKPEATEEAVVLTFNEIEQTEPIPTESIPTESVTVEPVITPQKPLKESILGFILAAIIAGLACILTPCVFPMIPMTVGFFVSGSKKRMQTVTKAIIFWLSVGLVYGVVGCIIAIFKSDSFALIVSTHWIPNLIFAFMFILFAASFFGMFEITLPIGMANKADRQVDRGGYIASFFMAIVLAIVSFSCTGPFVGSLISEAVKGTAVIKPILGFVSFGLAMGAPFLIFAIFPSVMKKLPKSGGWLNAVKVVFAFVMLGFSLKFIVQVDNYFGWSLISREVGIGFWMVLTFLMGFYLLGKIKFAHDSDVSHVSVPRLLFAIIAFTFGVYLIPGLFGADLETVSAFLPAKEERTFSATTSTDALTPSGTIPKYAGEESRMSLPDNIPGFYDLEEAIAYAKEVDKPILLDFTGIFCSNCKKMKASAFKDPRVVELINAEYVFVALYTDIRTGTLAPMSKFYATYQLEKFDVRSQPYFAVIDSHENILIKGLGYAGADELLGFLHKGLTTYR